MSRYCGTLSNSQRMPARSTSSDMPSTWVRFFITSSRSRRPARRDGEAAVADHRGGDAERGRGRGPRVPGDLRVVVRVVVDDARHQRQAVGVDGFLRRRRGSCRPRRCGRPSPPRRRARGGEPRPSSRSASRITRSNIALSILSANQGQTTIFSLDLSNKVAVVTGGARASAPPRRAVREGRRAGRGARLEIAACDVTDEARSRRRSPRSSAARHPGQQRRPRGAQAGDRADDSRTGTRCSTSTSPRLFLCSRVAHPHMKKRGGGAIVNLASIMGFSGGIYPERVLPGVEGRRGQPDARAGAGVGGRQHPRQRGGADLRAHRPHRADLLQPGAC